MLGLVWLGGWWLFALAARRRRCSALHEFYAMTRPLRPIVDRRLPRLLLTLSRTQAGGFAWVAGGAASTTFALAFLLKGLARHEAVGDGVGRRRRCSASPGSALGLVL